MNFILAFLLFLPQQPIQVDPTPIGPVTTFQITGKVSYSFDFDVYKKDALIMRCENKNKFHVDGYKLSHCRITKGHTLDEVMNTIVNTMKHDNEMLYNEMEKLRNDKEYIVIKDKK